MIGTVDIQRFPVLLLSNTEKLPFAKGENTTAARSVTPKTVENKIIFARRVEFFICFKGFLVAKASVVLRIVINAAVVLGHGTGTRHIMDKPVFKMLRV